MKHFFITKGEKTEEPTIDPEGYVCPSDANACRHTVNGITPYGVRATNEGGYSGTVVCLECVVEAYNQLKAEGELADGE